MTTILGASTSGMVAAQSMLDHVGANIANFQSIAYKRERAIAEGLPDDTQVPERARLGVAVTETDMIFSFGSPIATGDPLNFAITDDALFRVTTSSGDTAYTRVGRLDVDAAGQVTLFGQFLDPRITLPEGARSAVISPNGAFTAIDAAGNALELGAIELVRFANAKGLRDIGGGLYSETANSGAIVQGRAGDGNFAALMTGFLEGSNVDIAEEMAQMLIAQRTYQANAKSFIIGDEMLKVATNLTR